MPELPEVDTTRAGLVPYLVQQRIKEVKFYCPQLRYPLDTQLTKTLPGQMIHRITRRGKYLLFELDAKGGLLWHLGMSGSLRLCTTQQPRKKHDHVQMHIGDYQLCYHDPRRFGLLLAVQDFKHHSLLHHLGPEPLSRAFNSRYLYQACQRKKISIKQALMDHRLVVGVGNIYASEALFLAAIHPLQPASQVNVEQCQRLSRAVKQVLRDAIRCGGTTLRDFVNPQATAGYFKQQLKVYQRQGESCLLCGGMIALEKIAGRSSYYCMHCQKR